MKIASALIGGFAGACALTLLHQALKSKDPAAPRMDLLGMEAIKKIASKTGTRLPVDQKLYKATMVGDLISNTLYYSLAGISKKGGATLLGPLLGLGGGLGAVLLPKPLGLNPAFSDRTGKTKVMTMLLYLAGGMVAFRTMKLLDGNK